MNPVTTAQIRLENARPDALPDDVGLAYRGHALVRPVVRRRATAQSMACP